MKAVIIRDDDVSAFTERKLLEKIYNQDFFRKGFKVSLSIIPNINSSAAIGSKNNPFARRGYEYEPFIPKNKANTGCHSFLKNKGVAEWIRKNKGVEACLHGYSHTFGEYTSSDQQRIQEMLDEGRAILKTALKKETRTFVPPHERLSKTAWAVLARNRMQIFRNVIRPLKDAVYTVPAAEYGFRHARKEFFTGFSGLVKYRSAAELGTMEPYLFSAFWNLDECFEYACKKFDAANVFIMTNHHWEFAINPAMLAVWKKFTDYMAQSDFAGMTASEAFAKL